MEGPVEQQEAVNRGLSIMFLAILYSFFVCLPRRLFGLKLDADAKFIFNSGEQCRIFFFSFFIVMETLTNLSLSNQIACRSYASGLDFVTQVKLSGGGEK